MERRHTPENQAQAPLRGLALSRFSTTLPGQYPPRVEPKVLRPISRRNGRSNVPVSGARNARYLSRELGSAASVIGAFESQDRNCFGLPQVTFSPGVSARSPVNDMNDKGDDLVSAEQVRMYLMEHGVGYETHTHPLAYTTNEVAEAGHVSGKEMAKAVMLIADDRLVMAVIPGDKMVDLQKAERVLGAQRVRLAEEASSHRRSQIANREQSLPLVPSMRFRPGRSWIGQPQDHLQRRYTHGDHHHGAR
jgi:hypothetical protein